MKNALLFFILVVLIGILFTFNPGLNAKVKHWINQAWDFVSSQQMDIAISDTAEWKTYTAGTCGFHIDFPNSYSVVEENNCTGQATRAFYVAHSETCATTAKEDGDLSNCHMHTMTVSPTAPTYDDATMSNITIAGTDTKRYVVEKDDMVTISAYVVSPRGGSYIEYSYTAPTKHKSIALDNFDKIIATYAWND